MLVQPMTSAARKMWLNQEPGLEGGAVLSERVTGSTALPICPSPIIGAVETACSHFQCQRRKEKENSRMNGADSLTNGNECIALMSRHVYSGNSSQSFCLLSPGSMHRSKIGSQSDIIIFVYESHKNLKSLARRIRLQELPQ
jgi:hypothetical protein